MAAVMLQQQWLQAVVTAAAVGWMAGWMAVTPQLVVVVVVWVVVVAVVCVGRQVAPLWAELTVAA